MDTKIIDILLVEDNPDDADLILEFLAESTIPQFKLHIVDRLSSGLHHLTNKRPDVVLLDLGLPDSQGIETLDRMRTAWTEIAIIALTGLDDEATGLKAVQRGAQDYLIKGQVDGNLLRRSIRYALSRMHIENQLRQHRDRLEELVRERTAALQMANKQLETEVAEHKQAEEALRQSEQNLARAQSIAHLGSWDWDIAEQTLTCSDELYRVFGVSKETFELSYNNIVNMIHPDDRKKNNMNAQELLTTANQLDSEFRIIRPDGAIRHIHQAAQVTRDAAGEAQRAFGIMMDITERKHAEKALEDSEQQYRTLVDNALVGVYRTNQIGDVLFVNQALASIFGYDSLDTLQQHGALARYRNLDDREKLIKYLKEYGSINNYEVSLLRKSGETITALISAVLDEDVISGMILDISERKRVEESVHRQARRLRALTAQLTEIEETERRRLARELHDRVGQNLTALGINLNIALSQMQGETQEISSSRLHDSLELLEETTRHIRDVMADLRPPMLDDYGLLSTLRWYGEKSAARMGLVVKVQGQEPDPRLPAQIENTLFRIAQEALTNVVKHAQATQIIITLEPHSNTTRLVIADNGMGFEPEPVTNLEHSIGWGLTTMVERAEAIGGRCLIKSKPGEGTKIIVEVSR